MLEVRSISLDGPVFDIIIPTSTMKNSVFLRSLEQDKDNEMDSKISLNILDEEFYIVMGVQRDTDSSEVACKLVVYDLHKRKVEQMDFT